MSLFSSSGSSSSSDVVFLPPGTLIEQRFQVLYLIGSGSFGSVYVVMGYTQNHPVNLRHESSWDMVPPPAIVRLLMQNTFPLTARDLLTF